MHRRATGGHEESPDSSTSSSSSRPRASKNGGGTIVGRKKRTVRKKSSNVTPNASSKADWIREQTYLFAVLTLVGLVMLVLHEMSGGGGDGEPYEQQQQQQAAGPPASGPAAAPVREPMLSRINPFFKRGNNNKGPAGNNLGVWAKGGKPGGNRPYDPEEAVGDASPEYAALRSEFDKVFPETNDAYERRLKLVKSMRKHSYHPIANFDNIQDCPLQPPDGYPKSWPIMDIVNNWNPDDTTAAQHPAIYQGICVFDYTNELDRQKASNYRQAELPFVIQNDPDVLKTVERWNHPAYLKRLLGDKQVHRTEYSQNNHFMYWMVPKTNRGKAMRNVPDGWAKPTEMIRMTYDEWLRRANVTTKDKDAEHWYFRLIGCGRFHHCEKEHLTTEFLFNEVPFFYPRESLFVAEPEEQRGIHCRFGMEGVIAENHFDGSRNMIALLGGERRYILSHPDQCLNLALYPQDHPSGRHSAIDWSDPDLETYPQFRNAYGNEIVLQAGDVLYLPTQWFHYIVSLELNFQCNTRSGTTNHYKRFIRECGFAT